MDSNPWGLGYKLVTNKLGKHKKQELKEPKEMSHIVDTLFPTHTTRIKDPKIALIEEIELFNVEELIKAVSTLKSKKALGPDGIQEEILRAVAESHPEFLLDIYNSCLKEGIFPKRWKIQQLVLIYKGKGEHADPSAYRPLCMLDTAGKLLEKLIKPRLQKAIKAAGDFSDHQYGFRKGRSTIDAIQEVVTLANSTRQGNHYSRPVALLVTLDVRNAFNSASWSGIMNALKEDFRIPQYLTRIEF